jgi:hypothetical protein
MFINLCVTETYRKNRNGLDDGSRDNVGVPDSATPEASSRDRDRALFAAAGRNDAAMVERLLKQGASLQAQDEKG